MPVSSNFRRWAVVGLLCFGMVVSYVDRGNISHVEFYMRGITESWLRHLGPQTLNMGKLSRR